MIKIGMDLVTPCGLYCGACALYKKEKCHGCYGESEIAKEDGETFCEIKDCADGKGFQYCSDCDEFPCQKYKFSHYSTDHVDWIREQLSEG